MWSYRCLGSGTITKLSSCQQSDVAPKAISFFYIVLALHSRTGGGLWSCDCELPKLVTVSSKCFGSPNSLGPSEHWQGPRQALQGSGLCVCVAQIVPVMAFPFWGHWICQKETSSLTWCYNKKFWVVLQKWYHLFSIIFMILFHFILFSLYRSFLKALLSQCTGWARSSFTKV